MKKTIFYIFTFLFLVFLIVGCGTQRNVNNEKGKIHILETSSIERTIPGDRFPLPIPKIPNERPKGVAVTYKSEKGTVADTTYDQDGNVSDVEVI